MAQTAPPSADAPLPRPGRSPSLPRAARSPRLLPIDAAWMIGLALLAFLVSAALAHAQGRWISGACLSAATTALLYLYGWRARDRAAGVIAALFAATSLPFLAHTSMDTLFATLSVAALFAFLAGSSLLALLLAGLATAARPDGVLLGLVLAILALAQKRRRAPIGAALFVAAAVVAGLARYGIGHGVLHFFVAPRTWLLTWAVTAGMAFISWLLVPFCAELGEPARCARWLPLLIWAVVYLAVESFVRVTGRAGTIYGLAPLWFALAGGGLSRLLPAVTGEVPLPWARYGLATLAVLAIVGIRLRADLPLLQASAPTPPRVTPLPPAPAHPAAAAPHVPTPAHAAPPSATPPQIPSHTATTAKPLAVAPAPLKTIVKAAPPKTTPAKITPPRPTYHFWHRYTHYYHNGYYGRRR